MSCDPFVLFRGFWLQPQTWTLAKFMKERERGWGRETEARIYFKGYGKFSKKQKKEESHTSQRKRTCHFWELKDQKKLLFSLQLPWINIKSFPSCNHSLQSSNSWGIYSICFHLAPIPTPLVDLERTEYLNYSFDCRSGQFFMKIQDTITRRNNGSWTNKMFVRCSFYHSDSFFRWGNQVPEVRCSLQSMMRPELEHHFPICQNFPHFASFSPSYIQFF